MQRRPQPPRVARAARPAIARLSLDDLDARRAALGDGGCMPLVRKASVARALLQRDEFTDKLVRSSDEVVLSIYLSNWSVGERNALGAHLEEVDPPGRDGALERLKDLAIVLGSSGAQHAYRRFATLLGTGSLGEVAAVLLGEGVPDRDMLLLGRLWGVKLKDLLPAVAADPALGEEHVQRLAAAAYAFEREAAWKDHAALGTTLRGARSARRLAPVLLAAGCPAADLLAGARLGGVRFADLLPGVFAAPGMTKQALRAFVAAATDPERASAWNDRTLLDQLKAVDRELYLQLLPALGIALSAKPGSYGEGKHMSARSADEHIRAYLPTIGQVVPASRRVEGEVSVVDEADFQLAYDRQWMTGRYPGLHKTARMQCPAFVDVDLPDRHIWIDKDNFKLGTMVHEGMHKYADDALRNEMRTFAPGGVSGISQLDEGVTELFTVKVCGLRGLTRTTSYERPHRCATLIERLVGLKVLADAYFQGDLDGLKAEFRTKTGKDFALFATAIEDKKFDAADKLATV